MLGEKSPGSVGQEYSWHFVCSNHDGLFVKWGVWSWYFVYARSPAIAPRRLWILVLLAQGPREVHIHYMQALTQWRDRISPCPKGPCTYDVRTEGGGSRIAQFCGRIVLIGCVKCGRGEGGVKNLQNFADVICSWPLNREDASRISCEKFKWVVQFISIEGSKRTNSSFGRHIFVLEHGNRKHSFSAVCCGFVHMLNFGFAISCSAVLLQPSHLWGHYRDLLYYALQVWWGLFLL